MRRLTILAAILVIGLSGIQARPLPAQSVAQQVDVELVRMASQGDSYDPEPLNALGVDGLAAVLNRIFPETAPRPEGVPEGEIKRLIAQLGSEEYLLRSAATEHLVARAWSHRKLIDEATRHSDAEIRLRARLVLDAWEDLPADNWQPHVPGLSTYVLRIKDRARLEVLAKRTAAVLGKGFPAPDELNLVRVCLQGIAQGGDEASGEALRPLMQHEDAMVAFLVGHSISAHKPEGEAFCELLVDALASDSDEVVETVIKRARRGELAGSQRLRGALRKVFDHRKDSLKFQAAFPLMHEFRDAEAEAYLLAQTKSQDTGRAYEALTMLASDAKAGRPATRAILDHLTPHLQSTNTEFRRAAARSLATYAGEDVVSALIPLLGDKAPDMIEQAKRGLQQQPDQDMVRRLLAEFAEEDAQPAARAGARELLAKMSGK